MRLIRFGTADLPEPDGDHSMPIAARSALVELPNGAFDQDGGEAYFTPSKVSYRAMVVDAVDPSVQALLQEIGKGRNILKARLRDNLTDWVTWAKVSSVQRVAQVRDYKASQPLIVTWIQDYPFWMNSADGIYFDTGYFFDAGQVFDGNYTSAVITASPQSFTIDYTGNVKTGMGTIIITNSGGGSITNPRVVNNTNGLGFTYNGTVSAGSILVVDFLTRTVELNGVNVYDDFSLEQPSQVAWMELELGTNSITVYCDAVVATTTLYWQWKRHYL